VTIPIFLVLPSIWKMLDSYNQYLETGKTSIVFGFPEATTWMIFGLWGTAALFSIFYVIGFQKFIYTREDERKLDDIIKSYSNQDKVE
jgi:hypothetical protein